MSREIEAVIAGAFALLSAEAQMAEISKWGYKNVRWFMILPFLSLGLVVYRVCELEQPIKINLRANEKERRTDLISDEKEIQER